MCFTLILKPVILPWLPSSALPWNEGKTKLTAYLSSKDVAGSRSGVSVRSTQAKMPTKLVLVSAIADIDATATKTEISLK